MFVAQGDNLGKIDWGFNLMHGMGFQPGMDWFHQYNTQWF